MSITKTDALIILDQFDEENEPAHLIVKNKHHAKQIKLSGKMIEAQFSIDDCFIVFSSDGVVFEDGLNIYLLNEDLSVKDHVLLANIYTNAILQNLSIVDANTLSFSFFNKDEKWVLEILQQGQLMPLLNATPVKSMVSFFKRKWIRLSLT